MIGIFWMNRELEMGELSFGRARVMLNNVVDSLLYEGCLTCECFQGFLTQVQIKSDDKASVLINDLMIEATQIHACLGCDPCPPGDAFGLF
jgi:hypothetical protein